MQKQQEQQILRKQHKRTIFQSNSENFPLNISLGNKFINSVRDYRKVSIHESLDSPHIALNSSYSASKEMNSINLTAS